MMNTDDLSLMTNINNKQQTRRLEVEEAILVTSRSFGAYGCPLKIVSPFKYLGRVLSVADDDWRTVVRNIVKAQKVWWRMLRILNRERARLRISGFFFKAVIQLVFLFNAESWVVTPHMV